jgi:hypothetical protein
VPGPCVRGPAHLGDPASAPKRAEQGLVLAQSTGWQTPDVWAKWALGALAVSLEDAQAVDAVLGSLTVAVEEKASPSRLGRCSWRTRLRR